MYLISWTLVFCFLMYKPMTEACPGHCSCVSGYFCDGTYVYCSGLTEVPNSIPKDTCDLNLSRNKITIVQDNAFNGLGNLSILDLSSNEITIVQDNAFNGLEILSMLLLYNNKLTTIQDNAFNGMPNLQKLSLYWNKITTIPDNAFRGMPNLQTLSLYNNEITTIPDNAFSGMPNLQRLAVEDNPLHCDCILAEFVSFAKSRNLKLKYNKEPRCSTPSNLTGVLLRNLSLEEMDCYLTTATTTALETSGRMIFSSFDLSAYPHRHPVIDKSLWTQLN
ncbi:slit homolog 2 protein-like isoform X2 [Saccostrea echinata]|uniref:slit homolog 2 protein-like isoform X2 n=1 Tax=Saccostrea echinata TaxID=191078 RepID=UPI002A7ED546|nr:slit homolog 2 protein-like isoform X2 [Saccostrea echinata]